MNFYAISALINLFTSIILGGFTFLKNPKRAINISFFLLTIAISIWSVAYFFWQISATYNTALLWTRILSIGSTLIPLFYLQWILLVLGLLKDKKRLVLLIFGYLITAVFLYFSFSNLFVKELTQELNFKFWPKAGPLYSIYLLFSYIGLISYGLIELIRNYYNRKGIIRYQIKYIILATIISFISGATNFFLWYDIQIPPIGNVLVALYTIVLFYAMAKYRLMDIRVVIQKFIIFIVMIGTVYGFYYLISWIYIEFLGGIFNIRTYLTGLVVAPFFIGFFLLISKWIKIFANKYLFFSFYNYQETMNNLAEELGDSIDLDKMVNSIVNTIKDTMQLNRAGVLLISNEQNKIHYKISKVVGFDETNGISLVRDSFLTRYLQKTKKSLIREELSILARETNKPQDKISFEILEGNMEKIEASLCLPLMSGSKLIGIIVLGSKLSKDAYSQEDLQLLEMLSKQAATALENAQLYKQIRDFNKTLQQKVDEQTKEIKKAYEIEKKAREELERLDKAKNQFILASQHHLRTPVSGMLGYLDLIFTGTFGKVPKKLEGALSKFQSATKILSRLIDEFLDISQFQLGRKVVTPTSDVELIPILEEIVESLKVEIKEKGLSIKLEKDNLPKIIADAEKLKTALYNIIDNAVKYTSTGKVLVKANIKDSNILIEVKDTGRGLTKEEIKLLFDKLFERGDKADKFYATGRGIGLFMTTLIIEAHNGKIWAKSQGRDKGSSFFIQLPIK
jgi:signal transduction histidine kinase